MKQRLPAIVLAALCLNFPVRAQQPGQPTFIKSTTTGKVISASNQEPLPGAIIKITNTNDQTRSNQTLITNDRGEFILTLPDGTYNLSVHYLSHKAKTLTISIPLNQPLIISLDTDEQTLQEVEINAGYYTVKERERTGSISRITAEDISKQPIGNPLAALAGTVPGLVVTQANGIPGSAYKVQLRGQNSIIQGNDPFFIIDGMPFAPNNTAVNKVSSILGTDGLSPFNSLNPSDIESIEVLKDADATAIYGSRGANGVILITTKKGRSGKTLVSFNTYYGLAHVVSKLNYMNTQQYASMRKEAFKNDNVAMTNANAYDILVWDTTRYTNWQKEFIGGTANTTDAQLSISGGSAQTQFRIGGGYRREGTVFPGDFINNKGVFQSSLRYVSLDQRFQLNFSGSYTSGNNNIFTGDLTSSINLIPNFPALYDANGKLSWSSGGYGFQNPLAAISTDYKAKTNNVLGNIKANYKVTSDLVAMVNLGYNNFAINEIKLTPAYAQNPNFSPTGFSQFANNTFTSLIAEPQLSYNKSFVFGNLNIILGASFQQNKSVGTNISASGYKDDALLGSLGGAASFTANNNDSQYRYSGIYSRIGYSLNETYFLNITARRDGSSRFGPGRQYGNFGAVGLGWIFSNYEGFRSLLPFLNFAKLRGSYGTAGNDNIGDYQYLDLYSSTSSPYQTIPGINPTRLFNPDYGWEINRKLEAALDIGLFDQYVLLTAAWYRNRSDNQLVNYTLPTQTGFPGITANLPALVQNTGLELGLVFNKIKLGALSAQSSFSLTLPKNKLLEFPDLETSTYSNRYVIGKSLSIVNGYRITDRVDPATGLFNYILADGTIGTVPVYPRDLNLGIADLAPKFYGSFQQTLTFKNWQLDVLVDVRKQIGYSYLYQRLNQPFGTLGLNLPEKLLERWQQSGDETELTKFSQNRSGPAFLSTSPLSQRGSRLNYTDASFIRIKNVQFSYDLKNKQLAKIGISNVKLFTQGNNVFTFTNYYGLDPETQSLLKLPPLRTFTFGLNLTF